MNESAGDLAGSTDIVCPPAKMGYLHNHRAGKSMTVKFRHLLRVANPQETSLVQFHAAPVRPSKCAPGEIRWGCITWFYCLRYQNVLGQLRLKLLGLHNSLLPHILPRSHNLCSTLAHAVKNLPASATSGQYR